MLHGAELRHDGRVAGRGHDRGFCDLQFLDFVSVRDIGPVTLNIGGIANRQLADADRRRKARALQKAVVSDVDVDQDGVDSVERRTAVETERQHVSL